MRNKETILILDFCSQFNQLVARRVRECNVYSEVLPYNTPIEKVKNLNPKGIILIGESNAPDCDERIFKLGIPILSIGNGMDFVTKFLGEKVIRANEEELNDINVIKNFLYNICKCSGNWLMSSFVEESIENLKKEIGNKKVLLALSGGVDSSVSAVLLNKAVGKQLTCIFVDHGLLRKNEANEVENVFKNQFDINLITVNAEERFLKKLSGVSDPEKKRKIIGEEFIRVFEEEAKKLGSVDFLAQGTIYPDIIESGKGKGTMVKSHHNVGGLPDYIDFKGIIEPLKFLFKDEVRKIGLQLGLPKTLVLRQPFPGPGLAIRIIGEITKEKLEILRDADYIFREEIAKAGLDKDLNQYFAVLTNLKSVGVIDNCRTYDYTLALRSVCTTDFMTASWSKIPYNILEQVSCRIVNEVKHINRIVYDITSKPPATIEWE